MSFLSYFNDDYNMPNVLRTVQPCNEVVDTELLRAIQNTKMIVAIELHTFAHSNNNNKDTYIAQIRRCSRCANACQRQTEMFSVCS